MSNRPVICEEHEKIRSKTPQDQRNRSFSSAFRKQKLAAGHFNGLEGLKVCKSISAAPTELKGFNRKKMLMAVIPKVKNLKGWIND
jgi:hypothetical protein